MANSALLTMLITVLLVDAFCFMGQAAITSINPDAAIFDATGGGMLLQYTNQTDPSSDFPTQSETTTTGNVISDTYRDITTWFKKAGTTVTKGFSYASGLVQGPVPYVQAMNLGTSFNFVVGAIWYGLSLFLLVAFTIGRTGV